jgi:hypothetical protein
MVSKIRFGALMGVLFFVALVGFSACGDEPENRPDKVLLTFEQLNFKLNGQEYHDTAWGAVKIEYPGQKQMLYFNLAVNGRWVIHNIPVFSPQGENKNHVVTMNFDLDVPAGTDVHQLNYAFDLATATRVAAPSNYKPATVVDRNVVLSSGFQSGSPILWDPAPEELGFGVTDSAAHEEEFPNGEAGLNECVPAAVSNSLRFLNAKNNLGLTDAATSIDTMKDATGWAEDGCGYDWYEIKDKYMREHEYGITTRMMKDLDQVMTEMEAGQDVEVCSEWHCAAVVAIAKMANGEFILSVSHDTAQGEEGGQCIEEVIYDPAKDVFKGSPGFFDGSPLLYFVVECPA